jgi:hypothetical protein
MLATVTCPPVIASVLAFCLLPAYRGVSLSGIRWTLGFPFQSIVITVSQPGRVDLLWGAVCNLVFWLSVAGATSGLCTRAGALSVCVGARKATGAVLFAALLVVTMNRPSFIDGVVEMAVLVGSVRAGGLAFLAVFYVILPLGLAGLSWTLLGTWVRHRAWAVIGAVAIALALTSSSWCWRHCSVAAAWRMVRTDEIAALQESGGR